jgi:hypothetical protein
MAEPRSELERIVSRLLPGIVAQQLAEMGYRPQVRDGEPTGAHVAAAPRDFVPQWYVDATAAVTEFADELARIAFDPEAPGVTSEMRRQHWAAVEARGKATGILAEAPGRRDRSKDVYAAVGRGSQALTRLRAARQKQPTPPPQASPAVPAVGPYPVRATAWERTHWQGRFGSEIAFDRPDPRLPVLVEVTTSTSGTMAQMRRTEDVVEQVATSFIIRHQPHVGVIAPSATHIKFDGVTTGRWSLRVIDPDALPVLDESAGGSKSMLLQHTLGQVKAVLQAADSIILTLYPSNLRPRTIAQSPGPSRHTITLPETRGILHVDCTSQWSLDIVAP